MHKKQELSRTAFTLIELLVALFAVATVFILLVPSLEANRDNSKSVVCLSHLKELSTATRIYAANQNDILPGPLHPAINRYQTAESYAQYGVGSFPYQVQRQLSYVLRSVVGDEIDRIITCPAMSDIASDEYFKAYKRANATRTVFPTHYVLNNWGGSDSTLPLGPRTTEPMNYFGWSGSSQQSYIRKLSDIPNPSREWMTADAWYRGKSNVSIPEFNQEGPFQSSWSGEALPHFAPHFKRGSTALFVDPDKREAAALEVRHKKLDGMTNTAYFDGHAATVPSRTLSVNGFEILYGFPGTVNPRLFSEAGQMVWENGKWE